MPTDSEEIYRYLRLAHYQNLFATISEKPGSLSATLAVILIGAGIAWTAERRRLARVRSDR